MANPPTLDYRPPDPPRRRSRAPLIIACLISLLTIAALVFWLISIG